MKDPLLTAGVFFLDCVIKEWMEKNRIGKIRQPVLGGRIILEKYHNKGAALNFLAKKPKLMRGIHTMALCAVGVFYGLLLRTDGRRAEKIGTSLLLGGGLSNLYDRYKKGYVVDYFKLGLGPKWLKKIVFNLSDFFIFIGTLLTVAGRYANDKEERK
ncbi:MAG: signal peptidase II [Roseburia sp.]